MQNIIQFGASRAATAGYQVTTQPCTLYRLDGYCNGAAGTNTWLQLFDAAAAPATNDVPKKSLMLSEANGYSYTFLKEDMVSFNTAMYLALSKDSTKYVAVTDGATTSGDVTIDDFSLLAGTTKVGPTDITGIGFLEIWNASAGRKKLVQVDITLTANPAAQKLWLGVMAADTTLTNYGGVEFIPLFTSSNGDGTGTITDLTALSCKFGKDGLDVFLRSKGVSPTSGILYDCVGCFIGLIQSANPASLTQPLITFDTTSTFSVTGYYK